MEIKPSSDVTSLARSVDWPAIFAGAIGAAALTLLLMSFGSAVGFSMTSAKPYGGLSGTSLAIFSALWFAAVYVSASAAGGYITGRMRLPIAVPQSEREFRDGAHGFLMWAVSALIGVFLLSSAATGLVSGATKAAGAVGSVAAQGIGAADAATGKGLESYLIDKVFRRTGASAARSANTNSVTDAEKAEVARIFAMSIANGSMTTPDREHLAGMVSATTGLSQPQATERIAEAYATAQSKAKELEVAARDAAESVRKAGVLAAFLSVAVSLAGLAAATLAAACGGSDRDSGRSLVLFGRPRFW